jgi:hypothetical protein
MIRAFELNSVAKLPQLLSLYAKAPMVEHRIHRHYRILQLWGKDGG